MGSQIDVKFSKEDAGKYQVFFYMMKYLKAMNNAPVSQRV